MSKLPNNENMVKKILLHVSFTFNNTFLKNGALTQKYFSNMALEQKSLAL